MGITILEAFPDEADQIRKDVEFGRISIPVCVDTSHETETETQGTPKGGPQAEQVAEGSREATEATKGEKTMTFIEGERTMPLTIDANGTMHTIAHTVMPNGMQFSTAVATRAEVTKHGIRITTSMPGLIRKRQTIVTTIEYSPEDIDAIIRWKLEHGDKNAGEAFRKAILDIPQKAGIDWIKYFLQRLG